MSAKHILFTFNRPPYGSIHYNEGLRAALGVTSGADEHTVDVVYVGDGVYFGLRGVDRRDSERYINTIANAGYRLKAEKESLDARGINVTELAEDVEVIPRANLLELIKKADLTIGF